MHTPIVRLLSIAKVISNSLSTFVQKCHHETMKFFMTYNNTKPQNLLKKVPNVTFVLASYIQVFKLHQKQRKLEHFWNILKYVLIKYFSTICSFVFDSENHLLQLADGCEISCLEEVKSITQRKFFQVLFTQPLVESKKLQS